MFRGACKTHESKYDTRAKTIEQQRDRQVQYSKSNCLLTHGIEERRQKVTEELVIQTMKDEYGFQNVSTFNGKILYNSDDTPNSEPEVCYQ